MSVFWATVCLSVGMEHMNIMKICSTSIKVNELEKNNIEQTRRNMKNEVSTAFFGSTKDGEIIHFPWSESRLPFLI